jgi:hypothetical protein
MRRCRRRAVEWEDWCGFRSGSSRAVSSRILRIAEAILGSLDCTSKPFSLFASDDDQHHGVRFRPEAGLSAGFVIFSGSDSHDQSPP